MKRIGIKLLILLILTTSYAKGSAQLHSVLSDELQSIGENSRYALLSEIRDLPGESEAEEADELSIENWMSDVNYFTGVEFLGKAAETELEIEEWMTNATYFSGNEYLAYVDVESELQIEDWMVDVNYFSGFEYVEQRLIEEDLRIEKWMHDTKFWN